MGRRVLIVFLKVPEKGRVKTRLSKDLDEAFVLELYKGFIRDLMKAAGSFPQCDVYFWPPEGKESLISFLGGKHDLYPQNGADLGGKMAKAFNGVFNRGADTAVLIGSDIPELASCIISEAFERLEKNDAVIGPTSDGGYYLVGFTKERFRKDIFNGMKWSVPSVLEQTLKEFDRHALSVSMLSCLEDIDTFADLSALAERVRAGSRVGEHTRQNLKRL